MNDLARLKAYFSVPIWAEDMTEKILHREGVTDIPSIRWRAHKREEGYRGFCYHDKTKGITVSVGANLPLQTQKCLLIHELTHFVLPREANHGEMFYAKMFNLCINEGIPIQAAWRFERSYKVTASIVAAQIMAEHLDDIDSYNNFGTRKGAAR